MRRAIVVRCTAALVAIAGLLGAAAAQQERFELEAGFGYPLVSNDFEIAQDPSWFVRVRFNSTPRFQVGVTYEKLSTQGDIRPLRYQFVESLPAWSPVTGGTVEVPFRSRLPGGGEVDLELWGVTASLAISGEEAVQILLVGSIGRGELWFDNPGRTFILPARPDDDGDGTPDGVYTFEDIFISGRKDRTDIDMWYELGAAIRWRIGEHWGLRVQGVLRGVSPDGQNTVLPRGDWELVPTFGAVLRF